jgi:hypothetical protein
MASTNTTRYLGRPKALVVICHEGSAQQHKIYDFIADVVIGCAHRLIGAAGGAEPAT